MPEHHIEDFHATVAPHKVDLVVKMAQLYLMVVHATMENPRVIEVDPTVVIMKIRIHALVEILHLETKKNPSSSTYSNLQ